MLRVMLIAGLGLAAYGGWSQAQPQPPAPTAVNLLAAAPSIVAVSSTVANRAILPVHLVDGDLATAWNSRTGDLTGAWIAARVPAGAHVTAIRMTAGFTKLDPKLGDLFTMNPRIRKVRVSRNGAVIAEHALDPELRTLQELPIDRPGGDFKVEIIDFVRGSKPSWREISSSEFQIWGMLPAGTAAVPSVPVVRVGSLDPPKQEDCIAALYPGAHDYDVVTANGKEQVFRVDVIEFPDLFVCRVERHREHQDRREGLGGPAQLVRVIQTYQTFEVAPVAHTPKLTAGRRLPEVVTFSEVTPDDQTGDDGDGGRPTSTIALEAFPLTLSETALLAQVTDFDAGTGFHKEKTISTLYRVDPTGFTQILSFDSHLQEFSGLYFIPPGPSSMDSQKCQLAPPARPLGATPPALTVICETENTGDESAKPIKQTTRTTYRWTGSRYEPR